MDKNDMVKKLYEKAGISEEDARDALERSSWDMLDALQLLETEGKIQPLTASMTTVDNKSAYEQVTASASKKESREENREKRREQWTSFTDGVKELFQKSVNNSLIVRRKGEEILSVPVLIMVIAAILELTPMIIAFLVGFVLECSYSIEKRR